MTFSDSKGINQQLLALVSAKIQNSLSNRRTPLIIALDGGSGAGKSTLAALISAEFYTALIPLDDFYSANIPDEDWEQFTVTEKLKNVFDWKRLRNDVLEPLIKGETAKWYAFDFEAKLPDGTYQMQTELNERQPAKVILIDGAYSSSQEISDLVDLTILLSVPIEERHKRLNNREKDKDFLEKWHQRWDEVEAYYFTQVKPENSFDLVVKFDS